MKKFLFILFAGLLLFAASTPAESQTYGNTPALVARFECPPAPNQGELNLVVPDLQHFYAVSGWTLPGYPTMGNVTSVTVSITSQSGNGLPPEYEQTLTPNSTGETFINTGLLGDTTKSYIVSIVYTTNSGYNIRYNTTAHQAHEGWWIQDTGGFNTAPYSAYLGCSNITPVPQNSSQDYWYTYKDKGNGKGNGPKKQR